MKTRLQDETKRKRKKSLVAEEKEREKNDETVEENKQDIIAIGAQEH